MSPASAGRTSHGSSTPVTCPTPCRSAAAPRAFRSSTPNSGCGPPRPEATTCVPILEPADIESARAGEAVRLDGARLGIDDTLRVVGVPAGTADDPLTVLVASSLFEADRTVRFVRLVLLIATPLLLAALATSSWLVLGAALRPVEALTRGAEAVTAERTGARLPVPVADDEIHRLAVTLNGMLARLQTANERQREFVADAAHELRSPLTSARTQLEVALRHADRVDWEDTARGVLADTGRMSRLVDDLLVLARLDTEPTAPAAEPVDLGEVAAAVVERYDSARVPVTLSAADGAVCVRGDQEALARVLVNLVDNAARFAASRVEVNLVAADGVARLTVTDDGPGVKEADRERVFERFTRLDEARARGTDDSGAGLGLAIVRSIVTSFGGTITLDFAARDGDAGQGLAAVVRLPLVAPTNPG